MSAPVVTAWMRQDGSDVRRLGEELGSLATTLDRSERELATTLGSAATALGWEGTMTGRADAASVPTGSLTGRFADACRAAGAALRTLAATMSWRGPAVVQLLAEQEALLADPPRMTVRDDLGGEVRVVDHVARTRLLDDLHSRLREHSDALAQKDRACRDALAHVVEDLGRLVPPGTSPGFLRSLAPPGAYGLFQDTGVVDTDAEEALARRIRPGTPAQDVRRLIAEVPVGRLDEFLARHPHVAAVLAEDWDHATGEDPLLDALLEAVGPPGEHGPQVSSVGAVRRAWLQLTAEERARLRLLYPTLVGSTDGIAIEDRVLANRALVRHALLRELAVEHRLNSGPTTAELTRQEAARYEDATGSALGAFGHWLARQFLASDAGLFVHDAPGVDPDRELAESRARIDLYRSLLLDAPPAPRLGDTSGIPAHLRLLLVFDPRGDGRYAEWHGRVDAPNVGILVPGTYSEMASIQDYSTEAARIARDHAATTATVSWLGTDLPSSIVSDASRRSFSESGGTHLLRFVEGLGLAPERDVSLVGHSAGGAVVGYADVLGVDVDRVLHVASAGTGLGLSAGLDYRSTTWDGDAREVVRYTQTAPGDPIAVSQDSGWLTDGTPLGHGWGHEDTFADWVVLDTGRTEDGQQIAGGTQAHTQVFSPGSTAWDNVVGVITGGQVTPYDPEWHWWHGRRSPYHDSAYPGTPTVEVP
ncbi:alpha/beta hydrolase [Ornithinimicrobium cerasi]|uniref:Alpha/beta hydrolase n=1 Tax=Ornithinimicrobium cerasi TaxID=2248773 RepID=A0A285VVN7_9MICO|nr:alpha/beta hydrolase [Ornithinimicrobium cerasi]SOC58150.1 Alpha/beta hydrolase [Ornithinimicrobium cerasi]